MAIWLGIGPRWLVFLCEATDDAMQHSLLSGAVATLVTRDIEIEALEWAHEGCWRVAGGPVLRLGASFCWEAMPCKSGSS